MEGRSPGDAEHNRRVCSKKSTIDIPSLIRFLPPPLGKAMAGSSALYVLLSCNGLRA